MLSTISKSKTILNIKWTIEHITTVQILIKLANNKEYQIISSWDVKYIQHVCPIISGQSATHKLGNAGSGWSFQGWPQKGTPQTCLIKPSFQPFCSAALLLQIQMDQCCIREAQVIDISMTCIYSLDFLLTETNYNTFHICLLHNVQQPEFQDWSQSVDSAQWHLSILWDWLI